MTVSEPVSPPVPKDARAERLAARLRDNLRRRKAQARELDTPSTPPDADGEPRG